MADIKLGEGTFATVINDDATLADGVRAAGDLNNGTNLEIIGDAYLTVQWNTTAPTVNTIVGELYVLRGDGESSEVFPEGGDAGLGTDDDPQAITLVGVFETINPSLTVDETLIAMDIPLSIGNNRFVLKNVSGQEFDLTWQLDFKGRFLTSA